MQMAALTYQSHLTAATAANSSQRMDQYVQALAQQQEQIHQTQYQIIEQLAALSINQGDAGRGIGRHGHGPPPPPAPFAPNQFGRHNVGNRGGQGCGRGRGRSCGPPTFTGGHASPPHVYHNGEGAHISGTTHDSGQGILYTPALGAGPAPPVLKHHKEVWKLECVLFMWFRRG